MAFSRIVAVVAMAIFAPVAAAQTPPPASWTWAWPDTDFANNSVDWREIMSGGPPKDGIPALDSAQFVLVDRDELLADREPVITVEIEGEEPRAYPIRYLTWHEILNDVVGEIPVAVTFCPLCNSGIVFDRRVGDQVLSFGVSGLLRNSDMIMYDRQTESWWQQAIGTGIVGDFNETELTQLPAWMESWSEFKTRNPDGLVMAEPTGFSRPYGTNPYVQYDSSSRPFLYRGENPPHDIPPLVRVVRVGDRAWPLTRLQDEPNITEDGVSISWVAGQASALDTAQISAGKDVGSVRVRDAEGNDLPHDVMFAFAFHAFFPEGKWMLGEG